LRGVILLLY
jgi:hypothetical protein